MNKSTRRFTVASALALGMLLASALNSSALAAPIFYPSLGPVPPGVSFTNISESSGTDPVPLYGPPTAFSVGLDFNPTAFTATAGGGAFDITDGQLNFTIDGNTGPSSVVGIDIISLYESGDFTLAGSGTAATQVSAGAIVLATVTQVNGVNVAPIILTPSNGSIGFNLVTNPGMVQPWSLGTFIDVDAQMFSLLGPNQKATKVDVVVNNQMLSFSQSGSLGFIAKKEFIITVGTDVIVPEPGAIGLGSVAICAFGSTVLRRRRKRQRFVCAR